MGCVKGSYAEVYAAENGFAVSYIKDISELSVNLDGCNAAVMEAGMFEGRQYAAIRYCVCRSI